MKLVKLLSSFLLVFFLFQANFVFAHECYPPPPACKMFWEHDAVFVGTVAAQIDDHTFQLRVEKAMRGVKEGDVTVRQTSSWCDEAFKIGGKYIVYADKEANSEIYRPVFETTILFDENSDTIKFFDSLSDGKPEYSVVVYPLRFFTPIRKNKNKFRLEIWRNDEKLKSESNELSYFRVPVNEAGNYRLRVFLPKNDAITFTKPFENVIVKFGKVSNERFIETNVQVEADKCGYFLVPLMKEEEPD